MLSEALLHFGASSTNMVDDPEDNEDNKEICLTSLFSVSLHVEKCISHAADSVGLKETLKYHMEMHDHTDWIGETKESFPPLKVTNGCWIVPEWIASRITTPYLGSPYNIILNPGLAYGTGEHPTTMMCLWMVYDSVKGGERVLDYGTGLGILAIAVVEFGAALSVGVDIDPQAIESARHNAALNYIDHDKLLLDLVSSTGGPSSGGVLTETQKYDVVFANIQLNPLLDLADQIVSYAKPGAAVCLSGFTPEQVPSIEERYSPLFWDFMALTKDGWSMALGYKKMEVTESGEGGHFAVEQNG